ncbi:MAG TPA: type VI secretion system tip protein TssI/VgrG [Pseudomonas sp.]|uniref:type VI secretion system tip protein TssI/VgrG n=1 Tax=Pseudomonas sp. TaxID=306 RepID=UPI002EDA96A0
MAFRTLCTLNFKLGALWMFEDKQMPITLSLAGSPMDMRVLSFTGHDALNEPYRFDVDLISNNPHLDMTSLAGSAAWLAFGVEHAGVHGLIDSARQLYAGTCLSLYRITLAPSLLKLQQNRQRRVFTGLSVPQLIIQLLDNHGLDQESYRFEQPVGVYPPRDWCVQYDETDLHLLQRLCEEEGIHFRFEHSPTRHQLIFADDPASFPERQSAVRLQRDETTHNQPTIGYLSERLTIHADAGAHDPISRRCRSIDARSLTTAQSAAQGATNQPFDTGTDTPRPGDEEAHHRQTSARTLERLRCERRHIRGWSSNCALTSGQIIQVLDHPVPLFNDQWLLINLRHWGKQPEVLEGCDPHDMTAILGAAVAAADEGQAQWIDQLSRLPELETFDHGYRTGFGVLPWAMTFRPSCTHRKPGIRGGQQVTLMADAAGFVRTGDAWRAPIRYDWQIAPSSADEHACWALADLPDLAQLSVSELTAGDRLLVRHFDSDPDKPVICGVLAHRTAVRVAESPETAILLNGINLEETPVNIHLNSMDDLLFVAREDLRLSTAKATFELSSAGITITGPRTLTLQPCTLPKVAPAKAPDTLRWEDDLRLTEHPGLQGAPLANRIWYIVFMSIPGLAHLPRLEPRHFLYEGRTDERGYLGLTCAQMRELSARYCRSPKHLCLVHPDCCMTLQDYFAQNWSEQRLRAFMEQD